MCSNFSDFQSYELRFSKLFCLVMKRSFPVSFVFALTLRGYAIIGPLKYEKSNFPVVTPEMNVS